MSEPVELQPHKRHQRIVNERAARHFNKQSDACSQSTVCTHSVRKERAFGEDQCLVSVSVLRLNTDLAS
eukprot:1362387-Heterocapsa_arctica.AAC.1